MPINIGPGGKFYATGGAKTLPLNLIANGGSLFDDFETTTSWTLGGSGAVRATNTSEYKQGTQAVKLTAGSGVNSFLQKNVSLNLTGDWQQIRYWAYVHDAIANYSATQVNYLRLYSSLGDKSWWIFQTKGAIQNTGWRLQTCCKSLATIQNGAPTWSIVTMAFYCTPAAAQTPSVTFDDMRIGVRAHPCIMWRFDDGYASQYTEAYGYMRRYNMRGTLFQIGSWIDAATRVTHQQLQEMQAAGWVIGNHTRSSNSLTGEANQAAQEAQLANGKTDLEAWGLTGGLYVAYPQGQWNADTLTSMTNIGARLGWTTIGASYTDGSTQYPPTVLPWTHAYNEIGICNVDNTVSLATMKTRIDNAIAAGAVISPLFHSIGTGGNSWTVADFRALVDYVAAKARQGLITPITIDDYYKLSLGSATVPEVVR